jgi:hypothetical protein
MQIMRLARLTMAVVALMGLVFSLAGGVAAEDKKELNIKEIMKKGHKGTPPLCGKVASGKASKEEKQELLELYVTMSKLKPPKGDEESWKTKTTALVAAAKQCVGDDKDGPANLKKAVNCKSCHEVHKGN